MATEKAISDSIPLFFKKISSRKLMISSEIFVIAMVAALAATYHFIFGGNTSYWIVLIALIGFALSIMDSSMGMGYGTIGSPLLIILGFSSKVVVPSILFSQAVAGIIAVTLHQRYKNVNILLKGNDLGIVARLIMFGLTGTIIASFVIINISKLYLNMYIGILIACMAVVTLAGLNFRFSWSKVNILSIISGFNKALSGGGYGPVATTGLLISGNPLRNTVGATLFSMIFMNLTAFGIYLSTKSLSSMELPIFLTIGALVGSQIGPGITGKMGSRNSRRIFSVIALVLGILTIVLTLTK